MGAHTIRSHGSVLGDDLATREGIEIQAVAEPGLELGPQLPATRLHQECVVVERDRVAVHRGLLAHLKQHVGERGLRKPAGPRARHQLRQISEQILMQVIQMRV